MLEPFRRQKAAKLDHLAFVLAAQQADDIAIFRTNRGPISHPPAFALRHATRRGIERERTR